METMPLPDELVKEYMKDNVMTKNNLKTGMLVQIRDGRVFMNICGWLVNENGCIGIGIYKNDLRTGSEPEKDIVRVSKPLEFTSLKPTEWTHLTLKDNLYWQGNWDRYPLCEPQPVQLDCRETDCIFHKNGNCTNESPAITLMGGKFTCWSKESEYD